MPEPGELPLGVVAGVGAADHAASSSVISPAQMPDQRRHAMGLHRRQQRIEMPRRQRATSSSAPAASIASNRASIRA
jgi:hypothetical protein